MSTIALELLLVAAIYVAISIAIQRKFSNMARIKQIRTELNGHQSDLKKMGSSAKKEEVDAKQKKMMDLTMEMMRHQMKASFIIMPVSLILIYLIIPYIFPGPAQTITILSFNFSYRAFFVVAAFIISIISQLAITQYEKMTAKRASDMQTTTNNV